MFFHFSRFCFLVDPLSTVLECVVTVLALWSASYNLEGRGQVILTAWYNNFPHS